MTTVFSNRNIEMCGNVIKNCEMSLGSSFCTLVSSSAYNKHKTLSFFSLLYVHSFFFYNLLSRRTTREPDPVQLSTTVVSCPAPSGTLAKPVYPQHEKELAKRSYRIIKTGMAPKMGRMNRGEHMATAA